MNVVAFKPAPADYLENSAPSVSAEHLRMLCAAIDFDTTKIDENDCLTGANSASDCPLTDSADDETAPSYAARNYVARNYLVTEPGTDRSARVTQLVNLGLMECAAGPLWRGQYVHIVTAAGRQLIADFHRALFPAR